jgi:hypothetical protein
MDRKTYLLAWLQTAIDEQVVAVDEFCGLLDKENPGDSGSIDVTLQALINFCGAEYLQDTLALKLRVGP